MYSSCVRAVAALAVHVAAVIMTELLVLRLVVTEAARNPELAHLEHSFQHQYAPRNTTEVNVNVFLNMSDAPLKSHKNRVRALFDTF